MRVSYRATNDLPGGVAAALARGDEEVVVQLNRTASVDAICRALDHIIQREANGRWVYVGDVQEGLVERSR